MDYSGTRRRYMPGIEIFIGLREKKFDLFINILPGTDVSKKIEGDDFTLKLTYKDGSDKVKEFLHFETMKKKCSWRKDKLVDSVYIVSTDEYKLTVGLTPKLYAPRTKEMAKEMEKRRRQINNQKSSANKSKKAKKKKSGTSSFKGSHASGFARRTTTCYTYNNLRSPYQGGRCSPK